jgi:hypothetical protein
VTNGALITAADSSAEDAGAADEPAPAGAADGNIGRVSGLTADESGRFYFVLDGGDQAMEIRIDLPLEEYEGLSFDGAPWVQELDYTVRSGSTILTVAAERLARYEAGTHTIEARFQSETVAVVFDLRKPAPVTENRSEGSADVAPAAGSSPFPAVITGSLAALAAAGWGALSLIRSRRLREAGKR